MDKLERFYRQINEKLDEKIAAVTREISAELNISNNDFRYYRELEERFDALNEIRRMLRQEKHHFDLQEARR